MPPLFLTEEQKKKQIGLLERPLSDLFFLILLLFSLKVENGFFFCVYTVQVHTSANMHSC